MFLKHKNKQFNILNKNCSAHASFVLDIIVSTVFSVFFHVPHYTFFYFFKEYCANYLIMGT